MFSTIRSSVPPVPLFNGQPTPPTKALPDFPSPGPVSVDRMRRTSFQLCISRAPTFASVSSSSSTSPSPSLVQRARQMSQLGRTYCEHFRRLADEDRLPDPCDVGFPAADEFFAVAFKQCVGDSLSDARHFTAGWLHAGLKAYDLRDTVAYFDRLPAPAIRLACEALARAWDVGRDRHAFSYVVCSFVQGVPETHLQPALEGVARALVEVTDLGRHLACLKQFAPSIVMRTEAGKAAWSAAADTLFTREYHPTHPATPQAGKRKRDTVTDPLNDIVSSAVRETKHADDGSMSDETMQGTSDWMSDSTSESSSGSPERSQEDSPTLRPRWPGPMDSEADMREFIMSVMQPAPPTTPEATSVQASESRQDDFDSPASKRGRAVTPRARSPKA